MHQNSESTPVLILIILLAMLTEAQENQQWLQELQTVAPAYLLDDVRQLAVLDEHKAHDALVAIRSALKRNQPLTPVLNYGEVTSKLARGAQPSKNGLKWLKQQGFTTIVLLREPGVEETNYPGWSRHDYIQEAKGLGLDVVEIPIPDHQLPTSEQVQQFLTTVENAEKAFVHCSAGIGRTGIMAGVYLRSQGTPAGAALEQNRLYGAQPEKYPDHATQATFMTNYPLKGEGSPSDAEKAPR